MDNPETLRTSKFPLLFRSGLLRGWVLSVPLLAVSAVAHGQVGDAGVLSPAVTQQPPVVLDAGQSPDAGQTTDAGQTPDAGPSPDAAQTLDAVQAPEAVAPPLPPVEEPEPAVELLEPQESDEMVVTARRRKETLQSVPVAVTALNERALESSAIRDVSDLNGSAPGFTANAGGSQVTPGALSTAIRGIGIIEVEKSYELPVGTMIDGIILGNAVGSNVANFDLESIEILRGAQGTLFGRNVTAGLISLRTIRPDTQEYSGKAAFTLGAFNRQDYKFSVNVPIVENVLAARAAVMWLNEDGYMNKIVNNVDTGKTAPLLNQLYLVGSLLYTPTKNVDVYLKYEHQRYRGQGLPSIVASNARSSFLCASHPGDPNYCRPQNASGQDINLNDLTNRQKLSDRGTSRMDQEYDLDAITGEMTYRLSPKYSFVSLTGWRAFNDDSWTDIDGTPDNQVNAHRHGPYEQITEELRFHGQPRNDLNLVAGLYGWYSHYRAISETRDLLETRLFDNTPRTGVDNPATPWNELTDGVNPPGSYNVADAQQTSYSAAAFAQGDWEFLPNTTLTLGGRLTHDIKDLKAVFYTQRPGDYMGTPYPPVVVTFPADAAGLPFPAVNPGDFALTDSNSWTRLTGKANVSYMFDHDVIGEDNSLLLYGGYANGFRSGGFNGRPATVTVAKPYNPETVDQFELGVKSSWSRGRLIANVAGYYTLYHDKQESYQIPDMGTNQGYASAYGNAGEASIKGLELELSTMPFKGKVEVVDRFRLWTTSALTDARYDEFKVALSGTTVHDYAKGDYKIEMRLAPRVQVATGLDLPFEFPDGRGRIVPGVSYRYRTEQRLELTTEPDGRPNDLGMANPAGYLDTSLTAEWDNFLAMQWRLSAYVKNVTDYVELLGAQNVGIGTRAVYGRPRFWGLELQARYN